MPKTTLNIHSHRLVHSSHLLKVSHRSTHNSQNLIHPTHIYIRIWHRAPILTFQYHRHLQLIFQYTIHLWSGTLAYHSSVPMLPPTTVTAFWYASLLLHGVTKSSLRSQKANSVHLSSLPHGNRHFTDLPPSLICASFCFLGIIQKQTCVRSCSMLPPGGEFIFP